MLLLLLLLMAVVDLLNCWQLLCLPRPEEETRKNHEKLCDLRAACVQRTFSIYNNVQYIRCENELTLLPFIKISLNDCQPKTIGFRVSTSNLGHLHG